MWVVFAYKKGELNLLLKNLKDKLKNNLSYYNPKVLISCYKKNQPIYKNKPLIDGYIFCKSEVFTKEKNLKFLSYVKGSKSVVFNCRYSQKEIVNFISLCKNSEDSNGYIKQNSFLNIAENRYYKFTSGPFSNLIFKLLEKNKKSLKILIGKIPTIIKKSGNYDFRLV